jgi:hypothetical protein
MIYSMALFTACVSKKIHIISFYGNLDPIYFRLC